MSTAIADKDEEEKTKSEERAANERKFIATGDDMHASALNDAVQSIIENLL
jgi:hypothetical protein